ncbi:hypothetical protein EWM64_g10002 [Hericium alpestre]|uniref:HNH nuclease domain-containing protein n=1 Tax=Hericium alpestre TaxID=135208 RepID=A0A4Y9ZIM0_9AGAM|nr:hypothetical protein EWM64_g10002 [Hericium alpestre]
MMLSSNVHHLFDQLMISLTPSPDAENTYDVQVHHPVLRYIGFLLQVQFHAFITPEGDAVPPPSRKLLEIHAACAQIAHLSGAAEVLDEFYGNGDTDRDALPGLSHNHGDLSGVSALDRALRRVQVAGPRCRLIFAA